MRLLLLLITSLITFNVSADSANPHPPSVAAALAVLDDFMAAFNDEDIVDGPTPFTTPRQVCE